MLKTLTQMLTGNDPVKVAEYLAPTPPYERYDDPVAHIEKISSAPTYDAYADLSPDREADFLGGSGLNPDMLEKLASTVDGVMAVLSRIDPNLDVDVLFGDAPAKLRNGHVAGANDMAKMASSSSERQGKKPSGKSVLSPASVKKLRAYLAERKAS